MAFALGLDPEASNFGTLRYQLLHRTFAAWQTARDEGALTCVVLVHSFMNRRDPRSGGPELMAFIKALQPTFSLPWLRFPWKGPRLDGVDLWFVWVEER